MFGCATNGRQANPCDFAVMALRKVGDGSTPLKINLKKKFTREK
jgi:hypothetical protein